MTPPRSHWEEATWPWWAAVACLAVDLVGVAVSVHWLGWGVGGWRREEASGGDVAMAIVGNWSIVARTLLALAFIGLSRAPAAAFGIAFDDLAARFRAFGVACLRLAPTVILFPLVLVIVCRMHGRTDLLRPPVTFASPGAAEAWIWVFVVAWPPMEELLYRGVAHGTMRRYMGPWGAIVVGGLLFGLVHFLYGIRIDSVWGYALGGAVLAWIYERTGSLLFSWMAHVAANIGAAILGAYPSIVESLRA